MDISEINMSENQEDNCKPPQPPGFHSETIPVAIWGEKSLGKDKVITLKIT